jgi:hypothetical protein
VPRPSFPLPPPPDDSPTDDSFRLTVAADRPSYVEGEPVIITVEACNRGSDSIEWGTYDGQEAQLWALDAAGEHVAMGIPVAESEEPRWTTWSRGECRSFGPFTWRQTVNHITEEETHGIPRVPAGPYRLKAKWLGFARPNGNQPERSPVFGVSEIIELDGVTLDVSTDRSRYAQGQPVKVTVEACNPNSRPHQQTFVWRPDVEVRITWDGYSMAETPNEGPVEKYYATWEPGECRTYSWVWDQRATSSDPADPEKSDTGNQVPPGQYEVEVHWWGHSRSDVDTGSEARPGLIPDRVPFTVE